jgi:hypothetical protein
VPPPRCRASTSIGSLLGVDSSFFSSVALNATGCTSGVEVTTGKHLIPVGQEPTGISLKPTGISNSRWFKAYSHRLSADRRQMSGIRLFPSAVDGNN